jgi:hypothetical protein
MTDEARPAPRRSLREMLERIKRAKAAQPAIVREIEKRLQARATERGARSSLGDPPSRLCARCATGACRRGRVHWAKVRDIDGGIRRVAVRLAPAEARAMTHEPRLR